MVAGGLMRIRTLRRDADGFAFEEAAGLAARLDERVRTEAWVVGGL